MYEDLTVPAMLQTSDSIFELRKIGTLSFMVKQSQLGVNLHSLIALIVNGVMIR